MIDCKYFVQCKLGAGGSSDVFLVSDENNSKFAIKIFRKPESNLDCCVLSTLQKEYFVMEMLSLHPNILKWVESVCDGDLEHNGYKFTISYNITEYAWNGALSSYIKRSGCFDEIVGRFYIKQLASAVAFMHEWSVAHLDIKPVNILFDSNFNLKIMDFGTAEFDFSSTGKSWARRGTKGFMAPEVRDFSLTSEFDVYKADIYSLGVTMYLMLFGQHPESESGWWESSSTQGSNSINKLSQEKEWYTSKTWWKGNYEVMDLIQKMLSTNPDDRPSIEEVVNHPWLLDSSTNISEMEIYNEMSLRKDIAFPQQTKFNFE